MLSIIGGTGIYSINGIQVIDKIEVETPFGKPSAPIISAVYKGTEILFLPRHGELHQLLPHEINYRANIFALKKLGAKQLLSFSAVGSLQENIKPGEFVLPSQYFDHVKGNRIRSFFGDGIVAHISTAEPACKSLTSWVAEQAVKENMTLHTQKNYACIDGPRLGTKAESHFLRTIGCDVVGMTNVPEVFLAREAQLCYVTLGIVTDYDCWMDDPMQHVSLATVIEGYGKSIAKVKNLVLSLLATTEKPPEDECRYALKEAIFTPDELIPQIKKHSLEILRQ